MQTVNTISTLRGHLKSWRKAGQVIALVPTMGHLHRGHLSLIEMAHSYADRVVASIYINPMQFDRGDDLAAYPRTLQNDIDQLQGAGVDLLFTPDDSVVYPEGLAGKTQIDIPGMTDILCGAHRPGHFVGVATVVCKLFNMVQPDVAVFGEKDIQQLIVVQQMTTDLNLPVNIIAAPTWREANGLAMSSRNSYLSAGEFEQAALIYRLLCDCAARIADGMRDYPKLENAAVQRLNANGFNTDFILVRRRRDLAVPDAGDLPGSLVILAAAFLGNARLIDNLQMRDYLHAGNAMHSAR